MPSPIVRPKRPSDVEGCVAGLREVHEQDRYPWDWPDDPAGWLHPADSTLAAWVAVEPSTQAGTGAERVVGHVVLRRAAGHHDGEAVAATTGLHPTGLGLVARLWVVPSARGRGAARRLLAAAGAGATARGLRPMLDVVSVSREAIVLYESEGWTRVGSRPFAFADGGTTELYYYLSPAPGPATR